MQQNQHPTGRIRLAARLAAATIGLMLVPATGMMATAVQADPEAARARFESIVARWQAVEAKVVPATSAPLPSGIRVVLDSLFALEAISREVLPKEWSKLSGFQRNQLQAALAVALRGQATGFLGGISFGASPLNWVGNAARNGRVVLTYQVQGRANSRGVLEVEMQKDGSGHWRVQDMVWDRLRFTEVYRKQAEKTLKDYSFPMMVAQIRDAPEIILEDFEDGPVGGLPVGWTWRSQDDKEVKPYTVREERGNRFLVATDSGQSVILGKEVKWDLNAYPYISFRVRVNQIPVGGDERDDKKVDSAAGIYITYRKKLGLVPESVKYVWSSTLPVGAAVLREGTGRPWMVVIGSGTDGLGEWRTYAFDLRQAYRDTFGKNPPDKTEGIGILSDANSTQSKAFADYDDIRALRAAPKSVGSGVTQIMPPIK